MLTINTCTRLVFHICIVLYWYYDMFYILVVRSTCGVEIKSVDYIVLNPMFLFPIFVSCYEGMN